MSEEREPLLDGQDGKGQLSANTNVSRREAGVNSTASGSSGGKYIPNTNSATETANVARKPQQQQENTILDPLLPKVSTKVGPQRTSRKAQKLKLLPDEAFERINEDDAPQDRDVYSQVNRITDKPARRDAEKLGKNQRHLLPRVTAYCTASLYKMKELIRWLKDCKRFNHTHPKLAFR